MDEFHAILDAWAAAEESGLNAVLATVVSVSGSAYRRPGARMLMLPDGHHVGSISGGCLEGDVSRKAWWLTEDHRPALRVYDTTSEDDAVWEFGLGCNGVVKVLLERIDTPEAREALRFFQGCRQTRKPAVVSTAISGELMGHRVYGLAEPGYFVETILPPLPLVIFGAGHDAIPLVSIAKQLGWHVTVADGRPAYATNARFPQADEVRVLRPNAATGIEIDSSTAVVLMSHNYPQDRRLLREILPCAPRYIGVLGPRARTDRMLAEMGASDASVHAPIGLDIGAETPAAIALSIVAEIQAVLNHKPGGKLTGRLGPIHEAGDSPKPYPHPPSPQGRESEAHAILERESLVCSLGLV